eukprot:5505791-Amphidinium_carterae.1
MVSKSLAHTHTHTHTVRRTAEGDARGNDDLLIAWSLLLRMMAGMALLMICLNAHFAVVFGCGAEFVLLPLRASLNRTRADASERSPLPA